MSITDRYFSDIVRMRAGWKCERCGGDFSNDHGGLTVSHFISRGYKAVRWNFDNAAAICGRAIPHIFKMTGCHGFFEKNPDEHAAFFLARLGSVRYKALVMWKHTTLKGQGITEGQIRLGLREELKRMKAEERSKILGAK